MGTKHSLSGSAVCQWGPQGALNSAPPSKKPFLDTMLQERRMTWGRSLALPTPWWSSLGWHQPLGPSPSLRLRRALQALDGAPSARASSRWWTTWVHSPRCHTSCWPLLHPAPTLWLFLLASVVTLLSICSWMRTSVAPDETVDEGKLLYLSNKYNKWQPVPVIPVAKRDALHCPWETGSRQCLVHPGAALVDLVQ